MRGTTTSLKHITFICSAALILWGCGESGDTSNNATNNIVNDTNNNISSSRQTSNNLQDEIIFSSSSIQKETWNYLNPAISYETITDSRDGKKYKIVTIGNQVWMAENLNFETPNSYCYIDVTQECMKYGRLYTWNAAMTVCPSGWHLPSQAEWEILFNAVGGKDIACKNLKSSYNWNENGFGTNLFGFSALPAGYRDGQGNYDNIGKGAYFWHSTKDNVHNAIENKDFSYVAEIRLWYENEIADIDVFSAVRIGENLDLGYSVRCLKDDNSNTTPSSSAATTSSSVNEISSSSSVKANSSSSIKTASSSSAKESLISSSSFSYNYFTDSRDGQKYKTIKIGNQVWMAENLNYKSAEGKSFCYDKNTTNCTKYGRMYQRAAAMDSLSTGCGSNLSCNAKEPFQGVCPNGWHLPSKNEWGTLELTVGTMKNAAKILKSTTGWTGNGNGTDNYGFSVLPGGYYINEKFKDIESNSYFWTSSLTAIYSNNTEENNTDTSKYFSLSCFLATHDETCGALCSDKDDCGAYIRCIQGEAKSEVTINSSSSNENYASSSSSSLTISMGSMKDSRDGTTYSTVTIGDQTWMAENLTYRADSSFCYGSTSNYCTPYKNFGRLYKWATAMGLSDVKCGMYPYNCGYARDKNHYCPIEEIPHQGVCPSGWHIPTVDEWKTLINNTSPSSNLAADVTWTYYEAVESKKYSVKGTNKFGFNAYPAGIREAGTNNECEPTNEYVGEDSYTAFWTASKGEPSEQCFILKTTRITSGGHLETVIIGGIGGTGGSIGLCDERDAHSVRCIKD